MMVDEPGRTVLSFFDVLKTEGGGGRLASAMAERSDIICTLAGDMGAQEAIFSLLNAPPLKEGSAGAGKEVMSELLGKPGGKTAAVRIIASVYGARIKNMRGGTGDIVLEDAELAALKSERYL